MKIIATKNVRCCDVSEGDVVRRIIRAGGSQMPGRWRIQRISELSKMHKALHVSDYEVIVIAPTTTLDIEIEIIIDLRDYPGICPRCLGPAYIGLSAVDCPGGCR
jgi:hypothetical protein